MAFSSNAGSTPVAFPLDGEDRRGRDRLPRNGRRRLGLREPVGADQPNRPADVATVETLLRGTGDVAQSSDPPTGLFSGFLRDATQDFQRKNRLEVDGIVTPEGETLAALEEEDRRARCRDLATEARNLRLTAQDLGSESEELSGLQDGLHDEIDRLEQEREPFVRALEAAGIAVAQGILRGRVDPRILLADATTAGAEAAAREFIGVQLRINERRDRLEDIVERTKAKLDDLSRVEAERAALRDQQRAMDCVPG